MDYCAPRGIPHSTFLTWDDDDQDKALAWSRLERTTCTRCHTRPEEWDEDRGGSRDAYFVDVHTCPGCLELETNGRQANSDSKPYQRVFLRRNEEA